MIVLFFRWVWFWVLPDGLPLPSLGWRWWYTVLVASYMLLGLVLVVVFSLSMLGRQQQL